MGEPKLLLPWPGSAGGRESGDGESGVGCEDNAGTVIGCVLAAWVSSCVTHVVVVVRRDDIELQNACRSLPVEVVTPDDDPVDMKASIQVGMRHLEDRFHPAPSDRCFIAPADLPTISSDVIDALANAAADTSAIVVPIYGKKQSHPVLLPWSSTQEVFDLEADQGINRIVERNAKTFVHFEPNQIPQDIDTKEQYLSLRNRTDAK